MAREPLMKLVKARDDEENYLGYAWIDIYGFDLNVDRIKPEVWVGCKVRTNSTVNGFDGMAWEDVQACIQNGSYAITVNNLPANKIKEYE